MEQVIADLKAAQITEIHINEPLHLHTTWKVGGPADLLVVPQGKEQLVETVRVLNFHHIPWMAIGRGSNLLVADKGIRGAVIKLGNGMEHLRFAENTVLAGGAFSLIKLSVMAGKQGLTGLEFAGGIPGSVGGAVYMNAGAHGSDVSRILKSAEVLLPSGNLVQLDNNDLQFAYRYSILHQVRGIVTEAVFQLRQGDRKEIAAAMASFKDRRLRTQPLSAACAGSVFRNPDNGYAAKMIEECGLKGFRIGGAEVSRQHANFIVNTGEATAQDILALIEHIQEKVYQKFKVQLEREVLVVGER